MSGASIIFFAFIVSTRFDDGLRKQKSTAANADWDHRQFDHLYVALCAHGQGFWPALKNIQFTCDRFPPALLSRANMGGSVDQRRSSSGMIRCYSFPTWAAALFNGDGA